MPKPAVSSVTVAGNLQSEMGCCRADWNPACAATHLTFDTTDGQWHGTWTLPAGGYEWKVAINDALEPVNYGANGGGDNIALTVPAGGGSYRFTWDQVTHVPSVEKVRLSGRVSWRRTTRRPAGAAPRRVPARRPPR